MFSIVWTVALCLRGGHHHNHGPPTECCRGWLQRDGRIAESNNVSLSKQRNVFCLSSSVRLIVGLELMVTARGRSDRMKRWVVGQSVLVLHVLSVSTSKHTSDNYGHGLCRPTS